ncbi:MAG TPA: hypothetical protein VNH22_02515, partial [Blastocatellia bacterium]|nr:hypothetical protein [Blastocatellia bacterium]
MARGNVNRKRVTRAMGKRSLVGASDTELTDLSALKQEWSQRILMSRPAEGNRSIPSTSTTTPKINDNVLGIGVGEKVVEGIHVGTMAIKFFVRTKYPESCILRKNRLPKSIAGLPVDVEECGIFRSLA